MNSNNNKQAPKGYKYKLSIAIISLLLGIFVKWYQQPAATTLETPKTLPFTYQQISLTKHAKDRMKCRSITLQEIEQVLGTGFVNEQKTTYMEQACSTKFAIEGRSVEGQSIRLIVAPCKEVLNVVTVIDLENDHDCGQ